MTSDCYEKNYSAAQACATLPEIKNYATAPVCRNVWTDDKLDAKAIWLGTT